MEIHFGVNSCPFPQATQQPLFAVSICRACFHNWEDASQPIVLRQQQTKYDIWRHWDANTTPSPKTKAKIMTWIKHLQFPGISSTHYALCRGWKHSSDTIFSNRNYHYQSYQCFNFVANGWKTCPVKKKHHYHARSHQEAEGISYQIKRIPRVGLNIGHQDRE